MTKKAIVRAINDKNPIYVATKVLAALNSFLEKDKRNDDQDYYSKGDVHSGRR